MRVSAWAALAAHAHPCPRFAPVRGRHPLVLRPWGVTEREGRFPFAPLGKGDRRRGSLARFVHDPELVCSQRFERSDLRKQSDVGLEPPANVGTSLSRPRTPYLSLIKAGPSEGSGGVTHPTSPRSLAVGPLTRLLAQDVFCGLSDFGPIAVPARLNHGSHHK